MLSTNLTKQHSNLSATARAGLRKRFTHFANRSATLLIPRFTKAQSTLEELDPYRQHLWQAIEVNYATKNWKMVIDCAVAGHAYMLRRGPFNRWGNLLMLAIKSAERLDDQESLARLQYTMGQLRHRQRLWQQANHHLRIAEQFYVELGNEIWPPRIWRLFAEQNRIRGDFAEADANAHRALALQESNGDPCGLATTYSTIGKTALYKRDLEEAKKWLNKAIAIPQFLDEPTLLAQTYSDLGVVHLDLNEHDLAIQHFKQGLEVASTIGDYAAIGTCQ